MWPYMFDRVADGVRPALRHRRIHLRAIAQINFANAEVNPNAQTTRLDGSRIRSPATTTSNPVVEGGFDASTAAR